MANGWSIWLYCPATGLPDFVLGSSCGLPKWLVHCQTYAKSMIFFHNPCIRFEPKHPWQEKKEALAE